MKILSREELLCDYTSNAIDKLNELDFALKQIERNPKNAKLELDYLKEKMRKVNDALNSLENKINQ